MLWQQHSLIALLGAAVWGWVLLLPALGVAYGITKLFGGELDSAGSATNLMLWGAGVLALFFGYCVGYVTGYAKKEDEAGWEGYRTRSKFEETYRNDIADLQDQAEKQRKALNNEVQKLAVQLESATLLCKVCAELSEFLYREGDGSTVYGICAECDRLIQSGQRMNLISRATRRLAERTGIDPSDASLRAFAKFEAMAFTIPDGLAQGKVNRGPHNFSEQFYDGKYAEGHRLTPKSWNEEDSKPG